MKKLIFLAFFFISLLSAAPSCNDKNEEKKDDKISASDVPAAVVSAFKAKYPNATDAEWEQAKEDDKPTYKAKFKSGNKEIRAEFATDGTFIKEQDD